MDERGKIFGCCKLLNMTAKVERLHEFEASELHEQMEQHAPYSWSTTVQGLHLEYWPSAGKWRWNGKSYWGTLENFRNFLRKRGWNG